MNDRARHAEKHRNAQSIFRELGELGNDDLYKNDHRDRARKSSRHIAGAAADLIAAQVAENAERLKEGEL